MVVCPEPPAAEAGREIFTVGGNAMDAAIAAAFAQCVTNPLLCGVGGTGTLIHHEQSSGQTNVLNFEAAIGSVPVPTHWATEFVGRAETVGRYIIQSEANQVGHQSVMVPGFVRGLWDAYHRFGSGKLTWADLLTPAITLAKEGFEIYPYIAEFWKTGTGGDASEARPGYPGLMTKLHATPGAHRIYTKPDGSLYQSGDWLVQTDYGTTLERLAEAGGGDFYHGEIAAMIAKDFAAHDGLLTAEDLRDYKVLDSTPLNANYRGYRLTVPPPQSDGPLLIEMLKILEKTHAPHAGHNTPTYIDIFTRVQRASFSDNLSVRLLSSTGFGKLVERVTSDERAQDWADRINRGDRVQVRGGTTDPGTTQVTVIDAGRNVVTLNHSIGSVAGSGVVTPGLGFCYNNFLGHYNPLPDHEGSIEPGKRAGGGVPTIVFKEGKPYIATGAPGGSRIPTAIAQSLVNVLDFDMDMTAAVSMPRFHSEEEQIVYLEPVFPPETSNIIESLGNEVRRSTYMARVQAIRVIDNRTLEPGADPRGGAGVAYYP